MDKGTPTNKQVLLNDPLIDIGIYRGDYPVGPNGSNPVLEKLVAEGCENFFKYFELLGIANDPNIVVLPSSHHYYYDTEDMKEVKIVVNMKHLNHIKNVKDFLHSIYHILSHQSFFVGIFIDRKYQSGFFSISAMNQSQNGGNVDAIENGIESRIPFLNMMYNIMDLKTNRNLSKQAVTLLVSDAGFKVLNMTEISGLTYFCIQKVKTSEE
jgi:hypothetical protein